MLLNFAAVGGHCNLFLWLSSNRGLFLFFSKPNMFSSSFWIIPSGSGHHSRFARARFGVHHDHNLSLPIHISDIWYCGIAIDGKCGWFTSDLKSTQHIWIVRKQIGQFVAIDDDFKCTSPDSNELWAGNKWYLASPTGRPREWDKLVSNDV